MFPLILLLGCSPAEMTFSGDFAVDGEPTAVNDCTIYEDILSFATEPGGWMILGTEPQYYVEGTECTSGEWPFSGSCTPEPLAIAGCFSIDAAWSRPFGQAAESYDGSVAFTCEDTEPTLTGTVVFTACRDQ